MCRGPAGGGNGTGQTAKLCNNLVLGGAGGNGELWCVCGGVCMKEQVACNLHRAYIWPGPQSSLGLPGTVHLSNFAKTPSTDVGTPPLPGCCAVSMAAVSEGIALGKQLGLVS